jgi:hypothetical protein
MHQLFTRQHQRLNQIETSIAESRKELEAARTGALGTVQAARDRAVATREAHQQQFEDGVAQMKSRIEALKQQTEATVEGWKRRGEIAKLEDRARTAEEYAEAAMYVLDVAQEEARAASLEAIEARRIADEAKQGAGA